MAVRIAAALLVLLTPALVAAQGLYTEGQHYFKIEPAASTQAKDGKVEVVEVFSYACVHCASFEPFVSAWKQDLPDGAQFRALPAVFSPAWEPYARAFYAAQALEALDTLHEPLFKALHTDRKTLTTIEQIADFAAGLGIDRAEFLRAATSTSTDLKLRQAFEEARGYGIEGTPSMIVNGKYRVTTTGGFQNMLEVVNYLVAMESDAAR
jgi:thiol:disulfide interchange protein DsbA